MCVCSALVMVGLLCSGGQASKQQRVSSLCCTRFGENGVNARRCVLTRLQHFFSFVFVVLWQLLAETRLAHLIPKGSDEGTDERTTKLLPNI